VLGAKQVEGIFRRPRPSRSLARHEGVKVAPEIKYSATYFAPTRTKSAQSPHRQGFRCMAQVTRRIISRDAPVRENAYPDMLDTFIGAYARQFRRA
jgi:hypothetical protein